MLNTCLGEPLVISTSKQRQIITIRRGLRELREDGWSGLCFIVNFMDGKVKEGHGRGVITVEVGIVKVNNRNSMPADPRE